MRKATEAFGQYSDAALQAPGLNNLALSDAYRRFSPASTADNGGDEGPPWLFATVHVEVKSQKHLIAYLLSACP